MRLILREHCLELGINGCRLQGELLEYQALREASGRLPLTEALDSEAYVRGHVPPTEVADSITDGAGWSRRLR